MSTLLTAHALHVETAFGPLFNSLSFTLKKGDRIGLIGHNGCGKSTLLQVLDGTLAPTSGSVSLAGQCLMARVEQHLPEALHTQSLLQAVLAPLPADVREAQRWLAERLLAQMGFPPAVMEQQTATLSGGQHTRLLLARALIRQPDLLLLDEPGNHLDLPTLLWLESFLQTWQGSFVLVSHDNTLLDAVTNASWILRDQTLHCFALPCSAARQALQEQDESAALRHKAEQKEIDRVSASARRLATWGRVYDNEDLTDGMPNLLPFQNKLVQKREQLQSWDTTSEALSLLDVVRNVKPNILIGVSGQPGLFTEEIIREMHKHCPRPIVMPLSNPTSRVEATPQNILSWTDGEALVATGSPFSPVTVKGKQYPIAQCNNSYIFPGIGLGVIASGASRVTDEMLMAASETLAQHSPLVNNGEGPVLPELKDIQTVSRAIAFAVGKVAQEQGVAVKTSAEALLQAISDNFWLPEYRNYRRTSI